MTSAPRFTKLAARLPASVPFVGPETQERANGRPFKARLGANENIFGLSPKAKAAMQAALDDLWKYGDPEHDELRRALAGHHQIAPEHIIAGEGVDALLGYLCRLIVGAGDGVVTSDGAYPTFNFHVTGFGGILHKVPYDGNHESPDALIGRARQVDAKLIYLANPDNPMGSYHTGTVIEDMVARLPAGCLLVLDEAYIDLAPPDAAPHIAPDDPRVIRFRSFSKSYGLAGLRVGYAIASPPLIAAFHKVRNHFALGPLAQIGALAALKDQAWLRQNIQNIHEARQKLAAIALKNGLVPLPSATNFVTMDCGKDGDFARTILNGLLARGIFARMPAVPPHDRCIRISCGDDVAITAFDHALQETLRTLAIP